jgi:hypothetical protein
MDGYLAGPLAGDIACRSGGRRFQSRHCSRQTIHIRSVCGTFIFVTELGHGTSTRNSFDGTLSIPPAVTALVT